MHLIALHNSAGSGNPIGISGSYDRLSLTASSHWIPTLVLEFRHRPSKRPCHWRGRPNQSLIVSAGTPPDRMVRRDHGIFCGDKDPAGQCTSHVPKGLWPALTTISRGVQKHYGEFVFGIQFRFHPRIVLVWVTSGENAQGKRQDFLVIWRGSCFWHVNRGSSVSSNGWNARWMSISLNQFVPGFD